MCDLSATRPLRRPFGTELNLALEEVKDLCSRLQSCAAKEGAQKKAARRESGGHVDFGCEI